MISINHNSLKDLKYSIKFTLTFFILFLFSLSQLKSNENKISEKAKVILALKENSFVLDKIEKSTIIFGVLNNKRVTKLDRLSYFFDEKILITEFIQDELAREMFGKEKKAILAIYHSDEKEISKRITIGLLFSPK